MTVYMLVAVGFCALVIGSVIRSLAQMAPRHPQGTMATLTVHECVAGANALRFALDQDLADARHADATRSDRDFMERRTAWLERERRLEGLCALQLPERLRLKKLFELLEVLLDRYTTATVQFAGEVEPAVHAYQALATALGADALGQRSGTSTE